MPTTAAETAPATVAKRLTLSEALATTRGAFPIRAAEIDEESAKLIQADAQAQEESQGLLRQYTEAAADDDRAAIKEKLAETLEKQFSVQQQLREREVAKIEARVKKLRELIEKRNDAKRSIIDKRLDQLIREADGLGWNAPAAPAGAAYPTYGATYQPTPPGTVVPPYVPVPAATNPAKR